MTVDADTWVRRYAEALGVPPPAPDEIDTLLGLAGLAAHNSERTAAPLSCWLAAMAGVSPEQARSVAKALADALTERVDT